VQQIAKTGKYVGSDACLECHEDDHKTWASSRHTVKATKGPAMGKEFEKNIYEWVRRDWDKLDAYMIVDQKDAKTNYLAARKVPVAEVDLRDGPDVQAALHGLLRRRPDRGSRRRRRTAASAGSSTRPRPYPCSPATSSAPATSSCSWR
jgi:hypothetical protein